MSITRRESLLSMLLARQTGRLDWWDLLSEYTVEEWRRNRAIHVQK